MGLNISVFCNVSCIEKNRFSVKCITSDELIENYNKYNIIIYSNDSFHVQEILGHFRYHGFNSDQLIIIKQTPEEQYFGLDFLRPVPDEIYIDAGCYNGDTILKFYQFCNGNYFTTEYALGRLCTQKGMPSYTRMYGIQLLYEVLNKQDDARQIKEDYNYTEKSFREENGKYDIFGILPKGFEQKRTLYYDLGNGFNSDECIRQNFILEKKEAFEMSCTIVFSSDQSLKKLRFDPGEEVMLKVKIRQVLINGCEAAFYPENALNFCNA